MPVTLSDDATEKALKSIRRYFVEQLDQEIGELPSRLLLEFVLEEIGPSIYNGAIAEAQVYLRERVADLDGACYMPEFEYWPRAASRRTPR
jgi:uncharacterized protein (DUF2164 family)